MSPPSTFTLLLLLLLSQFKSLTYIKTQPPKSYLQKRSKIKDLNALIKSKRDWNPYMAKPIHSHPLSWLGIHNCPIHSTHSQPSIQRKKEERKNKKDKEIRGGKKGETMAERVRVWCLLAIDEFEKKKKNIESLLEDWRWRRKSGKNPSVKLSSVEVRLKIKDVGRKRKESLGY